MSDVTREALASKSHAIWSHWMKYMFAQCEKDEWGNSCIPEWMSDRWKRQMNTAYEDLSEEERESDRHQADKIMAALDSLVPERDWSTAPEWAKYWCVDAMESAWWFEHEPHLNKDGLYYWDTEEGHKVEFDRQVKLPMFINWRATLRVRGG